MSANRIPAHLNDLDGLKIVVREQGTTTAIELHGEWDLAGLPSIRQAISRVLAGVPDCVVLDLSGLGFIDSSGLHATVELAECSAAQNTRLVIIPGPGPVQRMFEITGLLESLPFVDEPPESGDGRPYPALAAVPRSSSRMPSSHAHHAPSTQPRRSSGAGSQS